MQRLTDGRGQVYAIIEDMGGGDQSIRPIDGNVSVAIYRKASNTTVDPISGQTICSGNGLRGCVPIPRV